VQRHQRHETLLIDARVGVADQRDLLQEDVERMFLRGRIELARDADQLLEVLDPALRLKGSLTLERV
jgi:hypothetical protein